MKYLYVSGDDDFAKLEFEENTTPEERDEIWQALVASNPDRVKEIISTHEEINPETELEAVSLDETTIQYIYSRNMIDSDVDKAHGLIKVD